jgi:chloramphenicol 3-O-phosphotransferase
MTNCKLIVVTGPAAAGKSTIAKALQEDLTRDGDLWLVMELDIFGRALPRDWISLGKHEGRHAERGFVYKRAIDNSVGLVLGSDGRLVLGAFHRTMATIVNAGLNVICETIVYDGDDWDDWCEAVSGIPTCWVKLSAPIGVLEQREQEHRLRTFHGHARGMSAREPVGTFDIEADTATEQITSIVKRIAAFQLS